MTDREKYMLNLIRTSADPSAAMEKVAKILCCPVEEIFLPAKFTICENELRETKKEMR